MDFVAVNSKNESLQLNVYVIHAKHLIYREKFLTGTLNLIKETCSKKNWLYDIKLIENYELEDVKSKINEIENTQIQKYTGDTTYFECNSLTVEQVSNFLKQKEALRQISELTANDDSYNLIIEDDCIIIPEFLKNLEIFLENPPLPILNYDIMFLCISNGNGQGSNSNDCVFDTRKLFKVIPSKEAYLITPKFAKRLLESSEKWIGMTKIMFSYRTQLSYLIHLDPTIKSMYYQNRISLEGSKIGILPSSVNENNIPIYNKDFNLLLGLLTESKPIEYKKATEIYKITEHLASPDIMHLYGVILHKLEMHQEAKDIFENAIDLMIAKNGLLTRRSELLNNAININAIFNTN
jgi:hypothetical protein